VTAGPNLRGLNRTIRALKPKLSADDEALIALARGLAAAVDTDPANAALWREYRAAVAALTQAGATGDLDDDTRSFLVSIATPPVRTAVGDPSNT